MIKKQKTHFSNCLYEGEVFHTRLTPKKHSFKYKVFCINFDLCKADRIFNKIPVFSRPLTKMSSQYGCIGP